MVRINRILFEKHALHLVSCISENLGGTEGDRPHPCKKLIRWETDMHLYPQYLESATAD